MDINIYKRRESPNGFLQLLQECDAQIVFKFSFLLTSATVTGVHSERNLNQPDVSNEATHQLC